jgi:hypothetical protein
MMKYIFKKKSLAGLVAMALLLATCTVSNAQDSIRINGIVQSIEKIPVENVSVSIEGSIDLPVLTNKEGEFPFRECFIDVFFYRRLQKQKSTC